MVRRDQIDWRLIERLGLLLLAVTILPVLFGIVLDHRQHTTPIITIAMMFIGFNLGTITIYRHITAVYTQISPLDPVASDVTPGGNPEHLGGDPC